MKIMVNKCPYEIMFVDKSDKDLIQGDTKLLGVCIHDKGIIKIVDYMGKEMTRAIVLHELTHAYLAQYGFYGYTSYNEESVCEIMSCYGDTITELANIIMKTRGYNA